MIHLQPIVRSTHQKARPSVAVLPAFLIALTIAAGSVGCGRQDTDAGSAPAVESGDDAATQMRIAMQRGDYVLASQYSHQALIANPNDPDLMIDAAKVAAFSDRKRDAAQLLFDAVTLTNYQPASRVDFAVQALIDVGELYKAIELLEKSLEVNPDNIQQRRVLAGFLGEAQRTELIAPHLEKLIRARNFDVHLLVALTEVTSRRLSRLTAERLMERNPDDHRVRLAEAHEFLNQHDAASAAEVLDEILKHHPSFAPAYSMLGQVLMEQRRLDEISAWIKNAPGDCRQHANYWLTLGDWAAERNEFAEASLRLLGSNTPRCEQQHRLDAIGAVASAAKFRRQRIAHGADG